MKDESSHSSREESIENGIDRCSAPHTPHTLHPYKDKEKRFPINIRLRRSTHDEFMRYCARSELTAGQFYEKAGILYMDLNPLPDGAVLIVSTPEQRNNLRDRMMDRVCVQEIQELLVLLERYNSQLLPVPKNIIERLCKTFDKVYKINNTSEELNGLVERALTYVE